MRTVTDAERRARLARRHAIAPAHRAPDPLTATERMTVLHATEPATVYLSLAARIDGVTVADIDRVLYAERTLVKQLAMRRTLFVFPRDLLPATWASASARVAAQEGRRHSQDVVRHGVSADGDTWLRTACEAVLGRLAAGAASAQVLREELPELDGRTVAVPEKKYAISVPFAPRVLTLLGARGEIVRGENTGHWRLSRPRWTRMGDWLGELPESVAESAGWAELVRRWLWTFGPGTEADLVWWLGATKSIVRRALADTGAVVVEVAGGESAYLLPDDVAEVEPVEPWAALLPVLDPTVMGWRNRQFYLPEPERHTDVNGNIGATAWWDGRVVGCWVQDPDGRVRVVPDGPLSAPARRALRAEAERLTAWLGGTVVGSVYSSPAMKAAREQSRG